MKKIILWGCFIFLIGATAACSFYNVNSEDVSETFYPEKKSAEDVVYLEQVDRPYEIIGYVTVNTERRQGMDEVMARMKREAAMLGGDAITNIKSDASGLWKKLPAQSLIGNAYIRANITAAVIVYKKQ
ncbi:MAG: hypothetical protein HQL23_08950 [Candidatus Omnitrophica bacterium]|nr:hypothetical protein [Candidatus Omnitrophota bacterium]